MAPRSSFILAALLLLVRLGDARLALRSSARQHLPGKPGQPKLPDHTSSLQKSVFVTEYKQNLLEGGTKPAKISEITFGSSNKNSLSRTSQSGIAANASTFAIVFRVHKPELPYLSSFLQHYRKLGVTRFYAFTNFPLQHSHIVQFMTLLPLEEATLSLASGAQRADADALLKSLRVDFVEEEYVINVDIDEYWVLPPGVEDLHDLVRKRPGDCYFFSWLLVPNPYVLYSPKPPYWGLPGHIGKWMARTSALDTLTSDSIHTPRLRSGTNWTVRGGVPRQQAWDPDNAAETGSLLHFTGRSFVDLLLKQLDQFGMQRHGAWRASDGMLEANGTLPARFLTTAFLTLQGGRVVVDPGHQLLKIDHKLEMDFAMYALRSFGHTGLDRTATKRIIASLHEGYKAMSDNMQSVLQPLLGEKTLHITRRRQPSMSHLCPMEDWHQHSHCPHYPQWSIDMLGDWLTTLNISEVPHPWSKGLQMLASGIPHSAIQDEV